jgi:hypothetical protein
MVAALRNAGIRSAHLYELLSAGLGCLMALIACQNILPSAATPKAEITLSPYRDSVLDLDMAYPQGWVPDTRKSFGYTAKTTNVYFEPPNTQATRRFTVKIIQPDHVDTLRTLEDCKAEFLGRLAAGSNLRIIDTSYVQIGGQAGYQAEYLTYLDGKPYVHLLEIICLRHGRDVGLSFETAEASADDDMLLFARVVDRFGFYSP